jgi:hypothetical protein
MEFLLLTQAKPELAEISKRAAPGGMPGRGRKILTNAAGVNRKVSAPEENPRSVAPAQRS